jgi:hypothetical protein
MGTSKEVCDGLEQVDEWVIVGIIVIRRLILSSVQSDVTRISTYDLNGAHTASRIARPACIAFAGG